MNKVIISAVVAIFLPVTANSDEFVVASLGNPPEQNQTQITDHDGRIDLAATCFFQYEQMSGMNKICYYDCLGSAYAITISAVTLCPLTINR